MPNPPPSKKNPKLVQGLTFSVSATGVILSEGHSGKTGFGLRRYYPRYQVIEGCKPYSVQKRVKLWLKTMKFKDSVNNTHFICQFLLWTKYFPPCFCVGTSPFQSFRGGVFSKNREGGGSCPPVPQAGAALGNRRLPRSFNFRKIPTRTFF